MVSRAPAAALIFVLATGHACGVAFAAADDGAAAAERLSVVVNPNFGETLTMAQSPNGYLWFGGLHGLLRFDGIRATAIDLSLSGSAALVVRRLHAARDGSIWLAGGLGFVDPPARTGAPFQVSLRGKRGGIWRWREGALTELLPAGQGRASWVWAIAEGGDGTIWLGGEDGLVRMVNGRAERIPLGDDPARGFVSALAFDRVGQLWVGTAGGLGRLENGVMRWGPMAEPITALVADPIEGCWGIGYRAVHRVIGTPGEDGRVVRSVPVHEAKALLPDGDNLWVAVSNALLRDSGGGALTPFRSDVMHPGVRGLLRDREGSTWVALKGGGAAQLRPTPVSNFGPEEGLPGVSPNAVLATSDGSVWFTTESAVACKRGGALTTLPYDGAIPVGGFRPLARARDGAIWIGAVRSLYRVDEHTFARTRFDLNEGLAGEIRTMAIGQDGTLWISGTNGGVAAFDLDPPSDKARAQRPRLRASFDETHGLCRGPYRFLLPTGTGVWVSGGSGAALLRDGKTSCFDKKAGLSSDEVTSVAEDHEGAAWLTFAGASALARVKNAQVTLIPGWRGLPDDGLYRVAFDGHGSVWLTSFAGIFRIRKTDLVALAEGRDGTAVVPMDRFTRSSGLRSDNGHSGTQPVIAWGAHPGEAWVSTVKAFSLIRADVSALAPVARALVEEVRIDGAMARPGESVEVAAGARTLSVRYSAPSFLDPARLRFEHRMLGLDADWVRAAELRDTRYSYLPPGRYTFQVRVLADRANPDPGTTFALVVRPAIHQTWWFRALVAVLVFTLIVAIFRLRIARERSRFAALHDERARMARELHDGLAQLFLGVGYHLDALRLALGAAPESTRTLIENTRLIVDRAQQETRRAIWSLRADPSGQPLPRLVDQVVRAAARDLGAAVTLVVRGAIPALGGELMHEVPRIVQEAITNAIRHGKATGIEVVLELTDRGLAVIITDNGQGLADPSPEADAADPGHGWGVAGMTERSARCGGAITWSEAPGGGGTRVTLLIPRDNIVTAVPSPSKSP